MFVHVCIGYAGVVRFGGLRIGGLSGIFKARDYTRGHFEHPPYNEDTKRSCYHIRNVDVFRLKQVKCFSVFFYAALLACSTYTWPFAIHRVPKNREPFVFFE